MRILLIDDHHLFGKSIQMILQTYSGIQSVDVITNLDLLKYPLSQEYDIVLIDINLTTLYEESGLELAEQILKQDPICKIMILTGYNRVMYEYRAIQIGAYGFVDKSIDLEDLFNIFQKVKRGEKHFSSMHKTGKKVTLVNSLETVEVLTKREIELLELVRLGISTEKICAQKNISERTVFNHLNNIYSKLHVSNRQEAVYKAELLGYFPPDKNYFVLKESY